jgi:hypothetical protein
MTAPPKHTRSCAPGWPGIPARWTSSAKSGVGTALGTGSRVWFTLSHGILNEIYYPRVDSAYYVRVPEQADAASPKDGFVLIKSRPPSRVS